MRISRAISSCAIVLVLTAMPLLAQDVRPVPPRITQDIDETALFTLRGNTHPLARAEYDQGVAPQDLPMERMLLLLRRSPEQEASLQQFLEEQQNPGSVHYHQWLTPEQFGDRFGPALEDIEKIAGWLTSQGFRVNGVANGRNVVEFSGTAAQVERALHTQIHSYLANGEQHWANARDPQIPTALAPVVAGIVSLHNFPTKALHHGAGAFRKKPGDGAWMRTSPAPRFTIPTNSGTMFLVAPYDFATIYDVLPLWNAGLDGTGQSVAIVARSNIVLQDVRNFRSVFGLPARDPVITLNGPDPGTSNVDYESENVSDVEWAGAVAKGATINLVVSESTATDGSILSSEYAVNNNLAPVLSSSYGACELSMTSQNQFFDSLWEQAAAEGITVVVATGDFGSADCDQEENEIAAQFGLAVNGFASTPYNVAVGGTDFSDVFSQTTNLYWSSSNNPTTLASAESYVPEMTWNDSCASPELVSMVGAPSAEALCNIPQNLLPPVAATGGGASSLYPKPSWQSGVSGIPSDGQRDVPDVSLFAGDGFWQHAYAVCQADNGGPCNPSSPGGIVVIGAGGTSFSAPAFAGIMALINQKTGSRQGLANPALYNLASAEYGSSSSPNTANLQVCNASAPPSSGNNCVFYDVTAGNNDVPCLSGTPNCYVMNAFDTYGLLVTSSTILAPAYSAGPGYDRATGLGSVNVANLVNQWAPPPNMPFLSIVKAHPGNFTQGQTNATYTVTVSNGASAGPTSGTVTVTENPPTGLTLVSMIGSGWSCTASACTRSDVLNAGSSYPTITVTVNVAPNAPSQVTNQVTVSGGGSNSATASDPTNIPPGPGTTPTTTTVAANPSSIPATTSTTLTATVTASGTPTGTVAFTLGSKVLGSAPVIGAAGSAQATLVVNGSQLAVGSNTITAKYSGDANFAASSGSVTVTVTPTSPQSVLPLMLPQFGVGTGFVTDFYAVNSGSSTANFSISFHDDNGNPVSLPFASLGNLSTLSGSIPAGGAAYYEAGTPQGTAISGSAVVNSDPAITIQALFRRQGSDGSYYEAAVPTASGSNEVQVPFDATTFSGNGSQIYTGLAIANLDGSNSANLSCTARDSGGNVIPNAMSAPMLNPLGHWANYLFPALTGLRGTLDCTSNTQIGAVGIRALGTNALSSLPVITLPISNSGGTTVLPQFGVGAGFVTDFYAVNSGSSTANFSISFHDDNGNPVALPFAGLGNLSTVSDSIPAGGAAYYEAGTPQGTAISGSAVVDSDPAITIQALFRRQGSDGSYYEAAVPMASGSNEVQVPFDATTFSGNGSQIYTGLAIANLDIANSANLSCTARDSQGNVIQNAISAPTLNPLGHWANYLFPALTGKRGTLDCTSNTQIGAVGIRALGANALSSLPVITHLAPVPQITSLTPTSGPPGSTVSLSIAGNNLSGVTAVQFSPSTGITVSNVNATATQVTATVNIAASAPAGPANVSVSSSVGTSNALVFTIAIPPIVYQGTVAVTSGVCGSFSIPPTTYSLGLTVLNGQVTALTVGDDQATSVSFTFAPDGSMQGSASFPAYPPLLPVAFNVTLSGNLNAQGGAGTWSSTLFNCDGAGTNGSENGTWSVTTALTTSLSPSSVQLGRR
jgi:hypothetical protein